MKKVVLILMLIVSALFLLPFSSFSMDIGMNLNSVSDWSTDHVFLDVFKKARTWSTQNIDDSGSWNTKLSNDIPKDINGWPVQVPFLSSGSTIPQTVHTLVTVVESGAYTLTFEGKGTFTIRGSGGALKTINSDTDGIKKIVFDVALGTKNTGTIWLEILSTDSSDYLKNIRILTPGYENNPSNIFHPTYKSRLSNFSVLRFMDWGRTNGSPVVTWEDRTKPDTYTQAGDKGVALEYMVSLANDLTKNMWICIPHKADDNYVVQCAQMLKKTVNPTLKIYVEYSNETWNSNSSFPQTVWVQDRGQALELNNDRWKAGQMYAALRSAEIWAIFKNVFGTEMDSRVVKVLASQSVNSGISEMRLGVFNDRFLNPGGIFPDALAIAPYFGGHVANDIVDNQQVDSISVADILDLAHQSIQSTLPEEIHAQKYLADEYDLDLICYEGGQHLAGTLGNENNDTLTEKLIAANRSPEMGSLYREYLTLLQQHGVSHFNSFSYIGSYNKWGSWGAFEHLFQSFDDAFKFKVLDTWIDEDPSPLEPESPVETSYTLVQSNFTGESPALNIPWGLTYVCHSNVLYHGWSLGTGVTPIDNDDVLAFSICNEKPLSSIDTALAKQQYVAVSVEPAPGWLIDLAGASASLTIRRLDNHGGHQYAVFSSVGGFNSGDEIFVSEYYDSWKVKDIELSFKFPQVGYTAIDGVIEFRVYPFQAQYCGKKLAISGFTLEGEMH